MLQKAFMTLSLNEFSSDFFLSNQLHTEFVKEEAQPGANPSMYCYGMPMAHNMFEDLEPVMSRY